MRTLLRTFVALLVLSPVFAFARTYDTSHLPYTDAPTDVETAVALSVLTEEGIFLGNPDRTFHPESDLNRAEFMQIVMRLLPPENFTLPEPCFRDVPYTAWFAAPVCRAKLLGIVRGNAVVGVPESEWLFEPSRSVRYEEAVKVLVNLYALLNGEEETGTSAEWYVPFVSKASDLQIALSTLKPGDTITRGEMARLVAGFFAYAHDELPLLRAAQSGSSSRSSLSSTSLSRSSSSSSKSSVSSSVSSAVTLDPLTDDGVRSSLILLGKTSAILGAAKVFSTGEPIDVDAFYLDLLDANSSISSFLVYNQYQELLGRATFDSSVSGGRRYRLNVKNKGIVIPQNVEYSFYVRAETRNPDQGGVSGSTVQIDTMGIQGTGVWSSDTYTKVSSETYLKSQMANSVITTIAARGNEHAPLVAGPGQQIGAFSFAGEKGSASSDVRVTSLSFYLSTSGGVTVGNVLLRNADSTTSHACSVSGSEITCTSIPAGIGTINTSFASELQLYADVTVPSGVSSASLQLTLIDPGSPTSAGDVTWTDGETTFTWVAEDSPVARGTYYGF